MSRLASHAFTSAARVPPAYYAGAYGQTAISRNSVAVNDTQALACDDATAWSATSCSLTNDTTNYRTIGDIASARSVKITASGTTWCLATYDFGSAQNFTDNNWAVKFFINEGTQGQPDHWTNIATISIEFLDASSNGRRFKVYDANNMYPHGGSSRPHKGWITFSGTGNSTDSSSGIGTGTLTWSAIRYVRVYITYTSSTTPSVTLDRVEFWPKRTNPIYMARFDDGNDDNYEVACLLSHLGLVGCFGINTNVVGTAGRLTWAQIQAMERMGHCICNHSHSHGTLYSMTNAQIIDDVTRCTELLNQNGVTSGSRVFIVPNGTINEDTREILRPYVDCVWMVGKENGLVWAETGYEPSFLHSYSESGQDAAALQVYVDDAVTYNAICSVYWHSVTGLETKLETHLAYVQGLVAAGTIKCATPIDILHGRY